MVDVRFASALVAWLGIQRSSEAFGRSDLGDLMPTSAVAQLMEDVQFCGMDLPGQFLDSRSHGLVEMARPWFLARWVPTQVFGNSSHGLPGLLGCQTQQAPKFLAALVHEDRTGTLLYESFLFWAIGPIFHLQTPAGLLS